VQLLVVLLLTFPIAWAMVNHGGDDASPQLRKRSHVQVSSSLPRKPFR
jgi:hypothetical protein